MGFSICDRLPDGNWEVFCVECRESIGTMSSEALVRAILTKQHAGGLKCPDCRNKSCKACGMMSHKLDERGLCWYCAHSDIFDDIAICNRSPMSEESIG